MSLVLLEKHASIARLTLNRPDKRNALNAALVEELKHHLTTLAQEENIRVIILTGAGKAFSAGADLATLQKLQQASAEENLHDSQHLAELFYQIYTHPKPIIAQINGHAIAGGCGLASVCDFSIAASTAKLGFSEVRIGFVPAIVMVFVLRKLGDTVARELFLRGHLISAEEAAQYKLITRCVPPESLEKEVLQLAQELTYQTSASAVSLTKRMLANVPGMGLQEALAYATQMNALARSTADCKAGIRAFLEKSDPPWRAR